MFCHGGVLFVACPTSRFGLPLCAQADRPLVIPFSAHGPGRQRPTAAEGRGPNGCACDLFAESLRFETSCANQLAEMPATQGCIRASLWRKPGVFAAQWSLPPLGLCHLQGCSSRETMNLQALAGGGVPHPGGPDDQFLRLLRQGGSLAG